MANIDSIAGKTAMPATGSGVDVHQKEASPRSSVGSWATVVILMVFAQISIMDRQMISLLVDPIKADLALSDTQLGLVQGLAFAVMYSIAGLPIGWAIDRYPRRFILYCGI